MIIEDGTGTGKSAKVDENNRLLSYAISTTEIQYKTVAGNAYTVGTTEPIQLTGVTQSAIFYLRNNSSDDMVFTKTSILISGTTDATNVIIIRNPLSITPNTGFSGGILTNSNFGEFSIPNITATNGAEEAILEGGTPWIVYYPTTPYFSADDTFVLPKGASFGIEVTPPSSNTKININIAFVFYTKTHI